MEMIIVMGIAVLLFGKRLPEVGRSLGKGIVEFKKGLNGVGDESRYLRDRPHSSSSYGSSWRSERAAGRRAGLHDASVPKFELPGPRLDPGPCTHRRWNINPPAVGSTRD